MPGNPEAGSGQSLGSPPSEADRFSMTQANLSVTNASLAESMLRALESRDPSVAGAALPPSLEEAESGSANAASLIGLFEHNQRLNEGWANILRLRVISPARESVMREPQAQKSAYIDECRCFCEGSTIDFIREGFLDDWGNDKMPNSFCELLRMWKEEGWLCMFKAKGAQQAELIERFKWQEPNTELIRNMLAVYHVESLFEQAEDFKKDLHADLQD